MFKGRFSNQRFSLGEHTPTFRVDSFYREKIDGLIGIGSEFLIAGKFHTDFKGELMITQAFSVNGSYTEVLRGTTGLHSTYACIGSFLEDINGSYHIGSHYYLKYSFYEAIKNNSYFGKNIAVYSNFDDAFFATPYIGKNIFSDGNYTEIVSCVTDIAVLEQQVLNINITLLPNSEIKIDSELFTLLLNNQNLIQNHKGDWILLDRDLVDLRIDSGTGGVLSGKILYKERYL